MNFFKRAPDDWQIVICPDAFGNSGEVRVELRGIQARFSPSRNLKQLVAVEKDDFTRLLRLEIDFQLQRARIGRENLRIWCGGCKVPLGEEPNGWQCWEFEVNSVTFAAFSVLIVMPGVGCSSCGAANFLTNRYGADDAGKLLGHDVGSALKNALSQLEIQS